MSEFYDMMLWVAYGIAALIMLTVIVSAVLAGLALRFVAESLRTLFGNHASINISNKASVD